MEIICCECEKPFIPEDENNFICRECAKRFKAIYMWQENEPMPTWCCMNDSYLDAIRENKK